MEGNGNGDSPLGSLRWLRHIWRSPPKAFTGQDAARALAAEGWEVEDAPPNGWHRYRHPQKPNATVTINVNWRVFEEGDAIFQVLRRQMGITAPRLVELLEAR